MLQWLTCTLQIGDKHVMWMKEKASDQRCVQPKHVKEKLCSEQYKRYNLSQGHHCGRADSRQWLEEHWFITEYIAANLHGLYTVFRSARVHGAVADWSDHQPGTQTASTVTLLETTKKMTDTEKNYNKNYNRRIKENGNKNNEKT